MDDRVKPLLDIVARRGEVLADLSPDITIEGWLMVILTELNDAARLDADRQLADTPDDRHQAALEMRRALARAGAAIWEAIDRLEHDDGAEIPDEDLHAALETLPVSEDAKDRILAVVGAPRPTWPDVDRRRGDRQDRRAS